MSPSSLPYYVEPLGSHDRAQFTCGIPELDQYFHKQIGQDSKRNVAAPFVMVDRESRVVGYYTLSAYALQGPDLPPALARKLPRYPLIPATFLGRLAIGLEHQGQKLGALLLLDALNRSWKNADVVASVGVVAEAINETARKFYLRHEFSQLGSHPGRVFLPMETIEKLFR